MNRPIFPWILQILKKLLWKIIIGEGHVSRFISVDGTTFDCICTFDYFQSATYVQVCLMPANILVHHLLMSDNT